MSSRNHVVGIFHPVDPFRITPGGIDRFISSVIVCSSSKYRYRVFGLSSDQERYPVGELHEVRHGEAIFEFFPVMYLSKQSSRRIRLPLIASYCLALLFFWTRLPVDDLYAVDFHRIEPFFFIRRSCLRRYLFHHTDMAALRNPMCDIAWRRLPILYEFLEHIAHREMDTIFSVSKAAVTRYQRCQTPIDSRFRWIPTCYDDALFVFRDWGSEERKQALDRFSLPAEKKIIVFVGRLDTSKDPLLLLYAFAKLLLAVPDAHLVFVGDGPLRKRLHDQVRMLKITNSCTLLGILEPRDVSLLLSASEALVISSAYEGMPIALLESLACGTPVVSTDVGEVRLVVDNKINGAIAKNRSPTALADALLSVLLNAKSLKGRGCSDSVGHYAASLVIRSLR